MRSTVILAALGLAACTQSMGVGVPPEEARDAGFSVLSPRDGGGGYELTETLIFEGSVATANLEMHTYGALDEGLRLVPSRLFAAGSEPSSLSFETASPDGRWAVVRQSTASLIARFYAVDLTQARDEATFLFETEPGQLIVLAPISNTHAVFFRGSSAWIVPLDGSSAPIKLTDEPVQSAYLFDGYVVLTVEAPGVIWTAPIGDPMTLRRILPPNTSWPVAVWQAVTGARMLLLVDDLLTLIGLDGSNPTPLVDRVECHTPVGVSADGRRLFCIEGGGLRELVSIPTDVPFGEATRVLDAPESSLSAELSADGQRLWIVSGRDVYVADTGADTIAPRMIYEGESNGFVSLMANHGQVALLDVGGRQLLMRDDGQVVYSVEPDQPRGQAFSANGDYLVMQNWFNLVDVINTTTGENEVLPIEGFTGFPTANGILKIQSSFDTTAYRMTRWGELEQLGPWLDRVDNRLWPFREYLVQDRAADGIWATRTEAGEPVRVADRGGANGIWTVGDRLLVQHAFGYGIGSMAVHTLDGVDRSPIHNWEAWAPWQVFDAGDRIYGIDLDRLVSAELGPDSAGPQTVYTATASVIITAAWSAPTTQMLIVERYTDRIAVLGVRKDQPPTLITELIGTAARYLNVYASPTIQRALIYGVGGDGVWLIDLEEPSVSTRVDSETIRGVALLTPGGRYAVLGGGDRFSLLDMATGEVEAVGTSVFSSQQPVLSRDGSRIAIATQQGIRVIDLGEEVTSRIVAPVGRPLSFSVDADALYYVGMVDPRVNLVDLTNDWTRIVSPRTVQISSVIPIHSSVPIVQATIEDRRGYYGLLPLGGLVPFTPQDEIGYTLGPRY